VRLVTLLLALAVSAPVAACGADDPSSATSSEPAVDVSELPEGRGVVTENADGTRTVTSAWGEVTVPEEPERIVSVIGDIDFEALLALGIPPIAAGTQGGTIDSGFAPHIRELAEDVEPLAWVDGTPAETIAGLEPDLIFAPDEESADLLSDIAPTVPRGSWLGSDWKEDFLYVAAVVGMTAEAEDILSAHEARVDDLRTTFADQIEGTTVMSPQVAYDHSEVYYDIPTDFSSVVLTEIGFTLAPLANAGDDDTYSLSFERLPELDADMLFWQVRQRDDDGGRDLDGLAVAQNNPLWNSVPAVAAGRVREVDNRPWYFPTILGAGVILDDVEAALTTWAANRP
jgi:iron complex transport system substrate-binding protein